MLMETPDETLALAAAGGDRAAFAALVTRHYDRIFALGWRLTGSKAEAEDLAQDICAALPHRLRGWRAALAVLACFAPIFFGFLLPGGQLVVWAAETADPDGTHRQHGVDRPSRKRGRDVMPLRKKPFGKSPGL